MVFVILFFLLKKVSGSNSIMLGIIVNEVEFVKYKIIYNFWYFDN